MKEIYFLCKSEWEGGAAGPGLVKPEIGAAAAEQLCISQLVFPGLEMLHKVLLGRKFLRLNSLSWALKDIQKQEEQRHNTEQRLVTNPGVFYEHWAPSSAPGNLHPQGMGTVISWSSSGGPVFLSHWGSPRNPWAFWILGLQGASLCKKNSNDHNLHEIRRNKTCSSLWNIAPELDFPSAAGISSSCRTAGRFLPSWYTFPGTVMGTSGSWSFHSSSASARPELHDLFLPLLIEGVSLSWKT